MKEKGLMPALIGDAFGTFILILLGDGVVSNVVLAPRLASGLAFDWNTIVFGWALAVIVAVYVSAGVSGAHLNPAVTISLAVKRGFPWRKVAPYIVAQMIGAFLGAAAVYLVYSDGLRAAGMPNVWCTGPGNIYSQVLAGGAAVATSTGPYSYLACVITEFFGTAMLLWGVLASGDSRNTGLMHNLGPFLVGGTVLAVGLSLGGPSGYAINPARDFGPRVLGTIVGTQNLFSTPYFLIPLIVPVIGGVFGAFTYDWFVSRGLPEKSTA